MDTADSKDYKNPVDVKGVEEFYGLVTDVGANKAVLVRPAGFSKAANERAQGFLIGLYSPVDTAITNGRSMCYRAYWNYRSH